MARVYFIISFLFFLSSCAQVGTLTGGDKDVTAPQPINEKMIPPNESVYFSSKSVVIPFKEFIQLKDPGKNIRMIPPHATIASKVKGRNLYLSWEDTLRENTTYTIYLNNAVKDISEGNDTIIQYVFSTGGVIDSLYYKTKVVDAWTNQPVEKCVVGLFDIETKEIHYFSGTDRNGEAILKYISPNKYTLMAFIDENNDLIYQDYEKIAFPSEESFLMNRSRKDTVSLRLFQPILKPRIISKKTLAKGVFTVSANRPLNKAVFYFDSVRIKDDHIRVLKEDSVLIFHNTGQAKSAQLIIDSEEIKDTLKFRFSNLTTPHVIIKSSHSDNEYAPSDTLSFLCNDFIEELDTSLIEIIKMDDSSQVLGGFFTFYQNEIHLFLPTIESDEVLVLFKEGAIKTSQSFNKDQPIELFLKSQEDYGIVELTLPQFDSPIILQMLKKGKVYRTFYDLHKKSRLTIKEIPTGNYTFRVIEDENNNRKWDVGDFHLRKQPEKVIFYSKKLKVRANWEVSVELE